MYLGNLGNARRKKTFDSLERSSLDGLPLNILHLLDISLEYLLRSCNSLDCWFFLWKVVVGDQTCALIFDAGRGDSAELYELKTSSTETPPVSSLRRLSTLKSTPSI